MASFALVVVISTLHAVLATNTSSAYFRLRQEIRGREALKEQVPPGGGVFPVSMSITFIPIDVLDVDDVIQVISLSAAVILRWEDPALAWDPSVKGAYEGIRYLHLPSEVMWKPLVTLVNGASNSRILEPDNLCRLGFTGGVELSQSELLHFTCAMDHNNYPFDTQNCFLIFVLFSSVNLTIANMYDPMQMRQSIGGVLTTGEWEMLNASYDKQIEVSDDGIAVRYVIRLKRKTAFYVSSFIIPVVMTSYMNTLVFVMSTESEERVSYLVSIFVSNAVFVGFCTSQMPQGMDSIPLVMYLVLGIMAESGLLVIAVSIMARAATLRHRCNDISTVSQPHDTAPAKHKYRNNIKQCPGDLLCFAVSIILNTIFVGSVLGIITGN